MSHTFLDLAKERYSVRKFTEQQIEQEKLEKILEAWNIGVASCWVNLFPNNELEQAFAFDLPANEKEENYEPDTDTPYCHHLLR